MHYNELYFLIENVRCAISGIFFRNTVAHEGKETQSIEPSIQFYLDKLKKYVVKFSFNKTFQWRIPADRNLYKYVFSKDISENFEAFS